MESKHVEATRVNPTSEHIHTTMDYLHKLTRAAKTETLTTCKWCPSATVHLHFPTSLGWKHLEYVTSFIESTVIFQRPWISADVSIPGSAEQAFTAVRLKFYQGHKSDSAFRILSMWFLCKTFEACFILRDLKVVHVKLMSPACQCGVHLSNRLKRNRWGEPGFFMMVFPSYLLGLLIFFINPLLFL